MTIVANILGPDLGYLVIIALIVLVAGSRLPKIARNVGVAGREFRKAQREAEQEAQRERAAPADPPPAVGPGPVANRPVDLSRAELDALLRARQEQVRADQHQQNN